MANLALNSIVKLRNGKVGVVMGFNGKPSLLVFDSFVSPLTRYDDNYKHKNSNYDIIEVYEGTKKITKYTEVYRKTFDFTKLKLVYQTK